jgi:hypothetical protein
MRRTNIMNIFDKWVLLPFPPDFGQTHNWFESYSEKNFITVFHL